MPAESITQAYQPLIDFIKAQFPEKEFIPLHVPHLTAEDEQAVASTVKSTFVSSVGPEVDAFEQQIAERTGAGYAVAVVNGTAALHLGLHALGVGSGDLVITQALSFVATANAIVQTGAQPVFIDVDRDCLSLSPTKVAEWLRDNAELCDDRAYHRKTGRPIKACVPMHSFGMPGKTYALLDICQQWGIALLEDAAEALGSGWMGSGWTSGNAADSFRHCGTLGQIGCLSFNGNKIMTCGAGGALLTDDHSLATKLKHLSTTAKCPHPFEFEHDSFAFNYRMPNLNAALGLSQLSKLPVILSAKQALADGYNQLNIAGRFLQPLSNTVSNYWLNTLLLDNPEDRIPLLELCQEQGIGARAIWKPLHRLAHLTECLRGNLDVTEHIYQSAISLPSSYTPALSQEMLGKEILNHD